MKSKQKKNKLTQKKLKTSNQGKKDSNTQRGPQNEFNS